MLSVWTTLKFCHLVKDKLTPLLQMMAQEPFADSVDQDCTLC